jgi:hypothetical protein
MIDKGRMAGLGALPAPAYDKWLEQILTLGPGIQEAGAFGCAKPFMAVADVEVGAKRGQVEVDLARRVRAVDHGHNAGGACPAANLGNRKDQRRKGADVADRDHPGLLRNTRPQLLHDLILMFHRQMDRVVEVARAATLAVEPPGAINRTILMVRAQHLVATVEVERASHDVDAICRVRHKHEVIGAGANVLGQDRACFRQQALDPAVEKLDRLRLKRTLPGLVGFKNRTRAGAVAAVIEKGHVLA